MIQFGKKYGVIIGLPLLALAGYLYVRSNAPTVPVVDLAQEGGQAIAQANEWKRQAKAKLHSADSEQEDWRKRALIHAATCTANCAMELEAVVEALKE